MSLTKSMTGFLIVSLCAVATSARCDDAAASHSDRAPTLTVDHATSLYTERWCILTFIANSRAAAGVVADDSAMIRDPLFANSAADGPMTDSAPAYSDRSSLYSRMMELPSLPLMTLWQGRESALVFGVGRSGMLGVSLDDTVAASE